MLPLANTSKQNCYWFYFSLLGMNNSLLGVNVCINVCAVPIASSPGWLLTSCSDLELISATTMTLTRIKILVNVMMWKRVKESHTQIILCKTFIVLCIQNSKHTSKKLWEIWPACSMFIHQMIKMLPPHPCPWSIQISLLSHFKWLKLKQRVCHSVSFTVDYCIQYRAVLHRKHRKCLSSVTHHSHVY